MTTKMEKIKATTKTEGLNAVYGRLPDRPIHLDWSVEWEDPTFAAGDAVVRRIRLDIDMGNRVLTLPVTEIIPISHRCGCDLDEELSQESKAYVGENCGFKIENDVHVGERQEYNAENDVRVGERHEYNAENDGCVGERHEYNAENDGCVGEDPPIDSPWDRAVGDRLGRCGRAIIFLSEDDAIPQKFLPAEEIIDRGYAIYILKVGDIASAEATRIGGIERGLVPSTKSKSAPGKLALWAWGAMRVREYASSRSMTNGGEIGIAAHSTLSEAAMLAAAEDPEIGFVMASCPMDRSELLVGSPALFCRGYTGDGGDEVMDRIGPRPLMISLPRQGIRGGYKGLKRRLDSTLYRGKGDRHDAADALPCQKNQARVYLRVRGGVEYFSRKDWVAFLDHLDEIWGKN